MYNSLILTNFHMKYPLQLVCMAHPYFLQCPTGLAVILSMALLLSDSDNIKLSRSKSKLKFATSFGSL